jgi:hypothetical protein
VERNDISVSVWLVFKDGQRRVIYGRLEEIGITGFVYELGTLKPQHNLEPIIKCDESIWEIFESACLDYCSKKENLLLLKRQAIEDKETMRSHLNDMRKIAFKMLKIKI